MGVQLGNLVESSVISIKDLAGKTIAFDGHNILYQFLAIIRGRQGEPLRDSQGRITSHLSGLIYRNSNLMEAGIRVVYVFDGEPHIFKKKVLESRKETRYKAKKEYEKAIKEGDQEKARRFGQQAVIATRDIVSDAKTLLTYMGIPWIQAPGEGSEADPGGEDLLRRSPGGPQGLPQRLLRCVRGGVLPVVLPAPGGEHGGCGAVRDDRGGEGGGRAGYRRSLRGH